LTQRLHDALVAAALDPRSAGAWTIDAPFRETVAEVRHYAALGATVVEMEAAALFAVGAVRHVEVAGAFAISDSLADGEWVPQFRDPRLHEQLARMVPAAVAALDAAEQDSADGR
jgi:purine-nucleoside phosphorylase